MASGTAAAGVPGLVPPAAAVAGAAGIGRLGLVGPVVARWATAGELVAGSRISAAAVAAGSRVPGVGVCVLTSRSRCLGLR